MRECNIEINIREIYYVGEKWMKLDQGLVQCRVVNNEGEPEMQLITEIHQILVAPH
jgi:hypothetical protein